MEQFDQTLFVQEEPLFEKGEVHQNQAGKGEPEIKKPPKVLFMVIGGVVILVVILISAMIMVMMNRQPTVQPEPVLPSPTPVTNTSNSTLDRLFQELNQDIERADPLDNIYPYPPVEADIRITPTN